jgi:hypothetical protein
MFYRLSLQRYNLFAEMASVLIKIWTIVVKKCSIVVALSVNKHQKGRSIRGALYINKV